LCHTLLKLWWVRHDVERAVREPLEASTRVAAVDRYLFEKDENEHARWTELVALSAITALAAWVPWARWTRCCEACT
jgi:hypothetical protein